MTTDRSTLQSGSVAVVAGGARGIGRACALRLAELGARVAVLDVDLSGAAVYGEQLGAASVADELVARAGDGVALQVDLTDPAATAAAFDEVVARWGGLDALVVPAGGAVTPYSRSLASETTVEDLSALLDVNLRVVVNSCRSAVPAMRASGGGSIVTVGSSAGLEAAPDGHVAGYGAAKAAVQHYTRYLANEVGPAGIRVNCVAPGVIRTARVLAQAAATGFIDEAALDIPLRRQGEPDDIADVVQFLLSPLSSYVSGQVIAVSGGAVHP
ncbi:SDR family NAD(P)-dependent oxidoreductase [Nocardioides sp.]|uniref:SDR family NAD(P)-dependent oxidoreductase n=1 Tax=Nocardioides sp. TaxID=35761 RepID=UPI002632DF17|nr:SDR family NAD(P)-dependent oxidoreductase [Nocardioides sp.]